MTSIEVTPAGNQLYEVEFRDEGGSSTHQVTVPEDELASMGLEELAVSDVVYGAMALLADREDHQQLDDTLDLREVAARYAGFRERVLDLAQQHAAQRSGPQPDPEAPGTNDERLREQVRREQREGEVSQPNPDL